VAQLLLLLELLRLKHGRPLELLSVGSTVFLHMLCRGTLPPGVNHFRNGEALFLGTDLVTGGQLPELRDDVVVLEAEINEIKKKSLIALGDTSAHTPFAKLEANPAAELAPDARGYRALISVGQLDTEVSGLTPLEPGLTLAGASSDISVVNVGEDHRGLDVGHVIRFKTDYSAFVRLLSARYVPTVVEPALDAFVATCAGEGRVEVPPALP
jgi:predicted amino acid racemase